MKHLLLGIALLSVGFLAWRLKCRKITTPNPKSAFYGSTMNSRHHRFQLGVTLTVVFILAAAVFSQEKPSANQPSNSTASQYGYFYKGKIITLNLSKHLTVLEEGHSSVTAFVKESALERHPLSNREVLKQRKLALYGLSKQRREHADQTDLLETTKIFAQKTGQVFQPVFEQGQMLLIPFDEIIVGFREPTTLEQAKAYFNSHAPNQRVRDVNYHRRNTYTLKIGSASNGRCFQVCRFMSNLPEISFAEPNFLTITSKDKSFVAGTQDELVEIIQVPIRKDPPPAPPPTPKVIPSWTTIASIDFESSTFPPVGWSAPATNAYWGRTSYRSFGGSYSAYCALSGTAGVTPPGPVPFNMRADLDSPIYNLTGYEEVYVEVWFYAKNDLFNGSLYDYCTLFVVNNTTGIGTGLRLASVASGDCTIDPTTSNGWRKCVFRVSPTFRVANAYFKFRYVSDNSDRFEGCYIDSIRVMGTADVDTEPLANDTYSGRAWSHKNVGQIAAVGNDTADLHVAESWDLVPLSTNLVLAIVDDGVDLTHADLNLVTSYDDTGVVGGSARGNHGTACAGEAGAKKNNSVGVIGTAPGVKIMSVYFGASWPSTYANAIDVAVANSAKVLSCSWGLNGVSSTDLENAITDALSAGRVLLFAAGNGPDRSPWNYDVAFPGNLTGTKDIICVGASSPTDEFKGVASSDGNHTWGSSYVGNGPDICAPGVWSYTTDRLGTNGYNIGGGIATGDDGNYTHDFGGTSAATPKVAGIVALMLSANPGLTPAEVKSILRNSADDIDISGTDDRTGTGRVNASNAVVKAMVNLTISLTDSPDPVMVNSNLTYNIAVTNLGPAPASSVTITDSLPANVVFVSATPSQGSYTTNAGLVVCNLGSIASNATATVAIVVKPTTATPLTNAAVVSSSAVDSQLANNTSTVTTAVTANAPPIANAGSDTTTEDTAKTITLSGSDAETCELTFSIISGPIHGSFGGPTNNFTCVSGSPMRDTNSIVYTPTANYNGPDSFTYKVNDGTSDSAPATVTLTVNSVNDAPAGTDTTVMTPEDTAYTFAAANFGFTDPNDSPTNSFNRVKITTLPALGTLRLSGSVVNVGDFVTVTNIPNMTFSPATNASGSPYTTFTFQVEDAGGIASGGVNLDQSPNTLTINVTPVNDAPTLGAINSMAIEVNAGLQTVNLTNISSGASNEIQFLTVTATSSNTGLIPNPTNSYTSPNSTGTLTFTPVANASGSATITVTVQDNGPTTNGGQNTFSRQFNVQVSSLANLAITQSTNSSPVPVGSNLVYTLTVTNRGPSPAAGLFVTNTFPATASFVTATVSQGTWSNASGKVVFDVGTLTTNASALFTVTVTPSTAGQITNVAQAVTTASGDPDPADNSTTNIATVLPVVLITAIDPTASETGPDTGVFTTSRLGGNTGSLVVNYTVTGPAISGSDYATLSGSVTIPNGTNQAQIVVTPLDDFLVETNETVVVTLATNSTYFLNEASNATVTITDNDLQSLVLSTTNLSVPEGGSINYTVRLSAQPTNNVTVTNSFTSGDSDLSVTAGALLLFTSITWSNPQPVTISAAEDGDTVNGQATFTVASPGLPSRSVTATEMENDQPPQLLVSPASLPFGTVILGSSRTEAFTVVNNGGQILTGSATSSVPFNVVGGSPFSLSGGQTALVQIAFNPTNAGVFSTNVAFISNGGNTTNTASGTGVTPAQIAVSPGSTNFGTVALGNYAERTFIVTNLGGAVLSNGVATVGAPFSITSGGAFNNLSGYGSTNVVVRFTPNSVGSLSSNVVFTTSNAGGSTNAVTGTAVTPGQIAVSPTNWDFGVVAVGANVERTFVVTNQGGAPVTGGSATVNAPFTIVSGSPFTLAGFGSTNVVVRFTPDAATNFSKVVSFLTADGGGSTNSVLGNGAIAPLALFSANQTNGSAPLTVVFTDTSTGTITNRNWNFGDGSPATNITATTISHAYTNPGTNTVTLVVSGPLGSSTNSKPSYISVTAPASGPPVIFSFSPTSGATGAVATITGANFGATPGENIVYFGAVRASVTAATSVNLTVTVPTGATYAPVSVTVNGLTAYSSKSFNVSFASSQTIDATSFGTPIFLASGSGPSRMAVGDFDADGKVDMAVANYYSSTVSLFRNVSASGAISTNSFATKVDLAVGSSAYEIGTTDVDGDGKLDLVVLGFSSVQLFRNVVAAPGAFTTNSFTRTTIDPSAANQPDSAPYRLAIGDLDGDGRPDLAVSLYGGSGIMVYRNTSSPGAGSFAAKQTFPAAQYPWDLAIRDLDGDGKVDVVAGYNLTSAVSVFRNVSSPGSIVLSNRENFTVGYQPVGVAADDVDGDGKPDLIAGNYGATTISVLRNTSTNGSINSGSFAEKVNFASAGLPNQVVLGDLNGDVRPEIVTARDSGISILRNLSASGTVSMSASIDYSTPGSFLYGISICDLDGDSRPDLIGVSQGSGGVYVFRNTVGDVTMTNSIIIRPGTNDGKDVWITRGGTGTEIRATQNYGGREHLLAGHTGTSGQYERFLIRFDLGQIPAAALVDSVQLTFEGLSGPNVAVEGYRLKADWEEGNGTGQSGVANWEQRTTGVNWSGSGFRSTDNGAFNSADAEISSPIFSGTLNGTGASTFSLNTTKVQEWISGTTPNFGILVRSPNESSGGPVAQVASSEHTNSTSRPALTITYRVSGSPPIITAQPLSRTNNAGTTATFTATASGDAPLSYQWRKGAAILNNDGNVSGATTTNLTLTSVTQSDATNYSVVVTNVAGSVTSAVVVLTVIDPPVITAQPQSRSIAVLKSTTFSVSATGTSPLNYKWYFNGTNLLAGATNLTFTLTDAQVNHSGIYSVVVSNAAGSVTSSPAYLWVVDSQMALTTPFRPGDLPNGFQGWWKFNGNATDSSPSGYHLSNVGTPAYVAGDYWATGEQSGSQIDANYWTIPDANCPNLALAGTSFTMAAWIKMDVIGPNNIILRKWASNVGYSFRVDSAAYPTASTGYLAISFGATEMTTQDPVLSAGKWHHVAFVYDKARSVAAFYVDGNCVRSITHAVDLSDNSAPCDVGYVFPGGFPSLSLKGNIKDLGVWNRALSPQEVKSLALGVDLEVLAFRPDDLPGLVSWWKMDEISDESAAVTRMDSGPAGNHLNDVLTVPGDVGGFMEGVSARFNGPHGSVMAHLKRANTDVASILKTDTAEQGITVSTWVYPTALDSTDGVFVLRDNTQGVTLGLHVPNTVELAFGRGGQSVNVIAPANSIKLNNWNHVALVFDPGADQARLYVDGVLKAAQAYSAGFNTLTADIFVGSNGEASGSDYMTGRLSDLAIWNRALTDTEIKNLATGLPLQRSGIASYWALDESSSTRFDNQGVNHLSPSNDVSYASGVVGNAARFVRSNNQLLSITNGAQSGLNITDDISILAWVKPESTGNIQVMASRGFTANGYALSYRASSALDLQTGVGQSTDNSGAVVTAGAWTHAAGTWSGGSRQLFFNGKLNQSGSGTDDGPKSNTGSFTLGANDTAGEFLDGLLDEVIVAQRWFREEEIKTVYNKGLTGQAVTSMAGATAPIITTQPLSRTNNAGTTATFTATANGDAPLSYQWRKGAATLNNGGNVSGATTATLTLTSVTQSDATNYTLVVTNSFSSVTSAVATLTVIDPPSITSQPLSRTNNAGTTATFSVTASGTAPLNYQWRRGGTNMVNGGNVSGAATTTLTLTSVTQSDAANYTLVVTNAAGSVTSSVATLTVITPPAITSQPSSRTNNAGTTATFSVTATGTSPVYLWRKGAATLTNGGNVFGATTATLTLTSVTQSDATNYTVLVTNAAGSVTSSVATLTVNVPPVANEKGFITSYYSDTNGHYTPLPHSASFGFSLSGASSASMSAAQPSPGVSPRRVLFGSSTGAYWSVTPENGTFGAMTFTQLQNIGIYKIYVTKGQSNNGSTNIVVAMTAVGGDLADTNGVSSTSVSLDVYQKGKPNHVWVHVGYITNTVPNPTVTFTHVGGDCNNTDTGNNNAARWYVDAVWFEYQDACAGVAPQVSIAAPLAQGQTFVNTFNIASGTTNVVVYANGREIGRTNSATGFAGGTLTINTTPLVKSEAITAKQIKNGCESLLPASGPQVGGGSNPAIRAFLGMYKDTTLAGPIGANATTNYVTAGAQNYFLKATGLVGGSFGNAFLGGETLNPSTCWQTVTFSHSDPNFMPSGGSVTNTDPYAALSGLAFSIEDTTESGPYEIYVDRIINGDVVIENFEGYAADSTNTFVPPKNATLPTPNSTYLSGYNSSTIARNNSFDGTNSCRVQWQWADSSNIRWAHVLANASTTSGKYFPQIDTSKSITLRYLVLPVGEATNKLFFTTVPESQTKSAGESVTFNVTPAGAKPFTYQWKFEGTDISGATTNSYTKGSLQGTDAGVYSVIVGGGTGCTTTLEARLTISSGPPTLNYSVGSGQITFTWSGTFTLQSKTDLNSATWTDVTSTSGYSEALNSATAKFFRLRQ